MDFRQTTEILDNVRETLTLVVPEKKNLM